MGVENFPGCTVCCGGVENCCCPGYSIPHTLTASDGANSTTLAWDGSQYWVGTAAPFAGCSTATIKLSCSADFCMWSLQLLDVPPGEPLMQPFDYSADCDPLFLQFNPPCGCGAATSTITVTE